MYKFLVKVKSLRNLTNLIVLFTLVWQIALQKNNCIPEMEWEKKNMMLFQNILWRITGILFDSANLDC